MQLFLPSNICNSVSTRETLSGADALMKGIGLEELRRDAGGDDLHIVLRMDFIHFHSGATKWEE